MADETAELTYETLKNQTVAQLRDLAQGREHEALRGYSTMHKDQLLLALCAALGIEAHEHHEVVGLDKRRVKTRIRALKVDRDKALAARDSQQLKRIRRKIHRLKRKIRKATV